MKNTKSGFIKFFVFAFLVFSLKSYSHGDASDGHHVGCLQRTYTRWLCDTSSNKKTRYQFSCMVWTKLTGANNVRGSCEGENLCPGDKPCGRHPNCHVCRCDANPANRYKCGEYGHCRGCTCKLDGPGNKKCGLYGTDGSTCRICSAKTCQQDGPTNRKCGSYGTDGRTCRACTCQQDGPTNKKCGSYGTDGSSCTPCQTSTSSGEGNNEGGSEGSEGSSENENNGNSDSGNIWRAGSAAQ